jgi:hypothetical protein
MMTQHLEKAVREDTLSCGNEDASADQLENCREAIRA